MFISIASLIRRRAVAGRHDDPRQADRSQHKRHDKAWMDGWRMIGPRLSKK